MLLYVFTEEHWKTVLPPEVPVDILVTHGPPHGVGDLTKNRNVGDKKLLEAVQKLEHPPVLWVVGHIHSAYGTYKCGSCYHFCPHVFCPHVSAWVQLRCAS
jgi:Icc-related predicted phosphoesterase